MVSKGPTVTGVYPAVLSQDKLLTVYACYFLSSHYSMCPAALSSPHPPQ